eukprot:gene1536-15985_t
MQDDDRFSEASFGSVISLRSVGSDGGFSPRPPQGTKKSKGNAKRASKVKKQESPYIGSKSGTAKKTGRELWVASIRQGNGMSAESSAMSTWNGTKAPPGQSKAMASTSAFLLDQLLMATGRPGKNHVRSASSTNVRVGGNGPAYKTAEEYYDEVIELKKRINQLMRENEVIKLKMHKVEEDNFVKARQIEELINPNMQTNEMRRTLTDKKADSSAVIKSLKHKLHSVERVVKNKDSELRALQNKLKNDMQYSDMAELQMQNEVCYQEIQRLTRLLTEPRSANTLQITSEIKKEKTAEGKIKKYSEAVESLSEDNNRLILENSSLKQDLKKTMELNLQTLNVTKDVEDMNRMELLAKISQLEQQIREEDSGGKDPETPRAKRSPSQSKRFPGKAGEEIKRLEEREHELLDEIDKQKDVISKLKEDRTHYRKLADEYRSQLGNVKSGENVTIKPATEDLGKLRSESVLSTSSSKKASKKKSTDSSDERKKRERKENNAALTIQRNWKKHRAGKIGSGYGKDDEENYDQAVSSIQAAFRGHAARDRLLRTQRMNAFSDGDTDDLSDSSSLYEDDVILLQAAFRGHLARQEALSRNEQWSYEDSAEEEVYEAPRFRRSLDSGEPMGPMPSRSHSRPSVISQRRKVFQTEENTTRSSIETRPSLSHLQKSSTSWGSARKSNIADFLSDSENEDIVVSSSQRGTSKEMISKKSSLSTQKGNSSAFDKRKQESLRLADRWATSGEKSKKNSKQQPMGWLSFYEPDCFGTRVISI